jgi:hypothetical protein
VEAAIVATAGVSQAAVVPRPTDDGGHRLAAFVVPEVAGDGLTATSLRASLAGGLPRYMVPAEIHVVDHLPLTPNGKIDRSALLATSPPRPAPSVDGEWSVAESTIGEIWREVLTVDSVRLEDDFFAIGGHSLLLTQVASRVRERLGVALPLRLLFEHPSLEGMASAVLAAVLAKAGADGERMLQESL